ncbi:MAG: K(+)-transporting ATPase subunit C [Candidatus Pseudobacter hemicellulosilyticus]|uniref:Potassium-transporting ATPase KdpC subunit n=1 Tax=Candidatus Pseudobacter hemicellulosilyticus TaxID=3121375 RepID=A0AAJ5WUS0_9BACT|nr:MAG: K(+)-transporting ATPase subunit C [Pseudobacter sp.]
MKKYILPSIKMTGVMLVLCALIYPAIIAMIGTVAPGGGQGEKVLVDGNVVGYANIGQKFTSDAYFWGRPSAVDYNAAGSAGSNKGPSNPDYLQTVQQRIDTFLVHHPGIHKEQLPAELVTASGSGLDPDISPAAAQVQVKRIAQVRGIAEEKVAALVQAQTEQPLLGLLGPARINVLRLNIALDKLQ